MPMSHEEAKTRRRDRERKRRAEHPDRVRAANKKWQTKNQDKAREWRAGWKERNPQMRIEQLRRYKIRRFGMKAATLGKLYESVDSAIPPETPQANRDAAHEAVLDEIAAGRITKLPTTEQISAIVIEALSHMPREAGRRAIQEEEPRS